MRFIEIPLSRDLHLTGGEPRLRKRNSDAHEVGEAIAPVAAPKRVPEATIRPCGVPQSRWYKSPWPVQRIPRGNSMTQGQCQCQSGNHGHEPGRCKTRQLTKKIKCATTATTRQQTSLSRPCRRGCERGFANSTDVAKVPVPCRPARRGSAKSLPRPYYVVTTKLFPAKLGELSH